MIKAVAFITKKAGMERQAFIDYYENRHVPLVCSLVPVPPVFKRSYLVRGDDFNIEGDAIGFDVVTEMEFPDRAAMLAWVDALFAPGNNERVRSDQENFLDRSRSYTYIMDERVTSK
jgi:uncharacterized protein (TIGR02118 family)